MSTEITIHKTKCQFKFGKEIKIKNDKISGAENGYVKLNSNQLKFTRMSTAGIPLIVGFLVFIIKLLSGGNDAALSRGAYALGVALGAVLITAVIVIVFNNINVIKVDRSQVINCMLESNSKRLVLKLSNESNYR